MAKTGPILVIDDDPDDQEMICRVLSKLNLLNHIMKFRDGEEAIAYLKDTTDKPLLILCDINMPLMNGIELKRYIESTPALKKKAIPFVFLTTTANPDQIGKAFDVSMQGFFSKGQTYDQLRETIASIISYWTRCEHPL
jgi:CheY-like chemotaxis protein